MKLHELSISDLSCLLNLKASKISRLRDMNEEKTPLWERLSHEKDCISRELQRRIDLIEYPKKSITKEKNIKQ